MYDHDDYLKVEKLRLRQKCEILMLRHREAKRALKNTIKAIKEEEVIQYDARNT